MSGFFDLDLDLIRQNTTKQRSPFPHQVEAFEALERTFLIPIKGYKGALLVLPTGGGKTFTATNWIARSILSRNIKVLWLAQSSYLLDQAAQSFKREAANIPHTRSTLKIRTVSSSSSHANSGSIDLNDDVIIITTQTAISDVLNETIGLKGETIKYKLRQWIDGNHGNEMFVVLDEAHHAPAYGCRSLLLELRNIVPNLYLLGLTATPTHNDQRIRGWLEKIFTCGICYQADIHKLYQSNILAVPAYIQKPTGRDMEVDDRLYDRIVNQHKDLPDAIIDILANDSARNNFVINDYLQNRNEYGKTIIFADRWFQCEYMVSKLRENGVSADCVYVMQSGSREASFDGQGRRNNKLNEQVLNDFREGKLDVLINVKMLTEGVDVPDVKTVMLTRNTTSSILFTQMIGRALRGKKAGAGTDKDKANIVLFVDNWKRLLPFANLADLSGGTEDTRVIKRGVPPLEWVSILLVQRVCKDIAFTGCESYPCSYYMPVGWYETEYTISVENDDSEEMITSSNSVMVFESNSGGYKRLIESLLSRESPQKWSSEQMDEDVILEKLLPLISGIFNLEEDDVDGNLQKSIIHIVRHISQNGTSPEYIPFEIREQYDIDRLVNQFEMLNMPQQIARLKNDYHDNRLLWAKLYKRYEWFQQAFFDAVMRKYNDSESGRVEYKTTDPIPEQDARQLTDYRAALLSRDHNSCRCCGRQNGKGVKLEIDHIVPIKLGGETRLDNLQILCKSCNHEKGTQILSFLNNKTHVESSMEFKLLYTNAQETVDCTVKRIINFFYRCNAVSNILLHQRSSGKHYRVWTIQLHEGNPVDWLLPHKEKLLNYINDELGWTHVEDINITTV
jgi:superfamily II DNA or RNA helicase